MDIPFHFGRGSTPGGVFPTPFISFGIGFGIFPFFHLAGDGRRGAGIGAMAEGCSITARVMRSTATHFTIATPTSTAIIGALRRLLAATAACAVIARRQGAPLLRSARTRAAAPPLRAGSRAATPCDTAGRSGSARAGTRTGAFGGITRGGDARSFSSRGKSSMGGGMRGGGKSGGGGGGEAWRWRPPLIPC